MTIRDISLLRARSASEACLPYSCRRSPATVAGTKEALSPGSGKQTLLIVDDEQDILDIMRDSLENQGYKVFATGDSTVAIDIYRRIFHEVALVITDIVMPGIDGRELIRQIKVINPDVKVLAISGYTKYVGEKEDIKDIDGFLQKPFESYYLLSVVSEYSIQSQKNSSLSNGKSPHNRSLVLRITTFPGNESSIIVDAAPPEDAPESSLSG